MKMVGCMFEWSSGWTDFPRQAIKQKNYMSNMSTLKGTIIANIHPVFGSTNGASVFMVDDFDIKTVCLSHVKYLKQALEKNYEVTVGMKGKNFSMLAWNSMPSVWWFYKCVERMDSHPWSWQDMAQLENSWFPRFQGDAWYPMSHMWFFKHQANSALNDKLSKNGNFARQSHQNHHSKAQCGWKACQHQ